MSDVVSELAIGGIIRREEAYTVQECGRTCSICPASLICHNADDPDGPDFDPAEIAYYLELET